VRATNAIKVLCFVAVLVLGGCDRDPHKLSSADLSAFNSASAEIKQTWTRGLTASRASDYLTAHTNLTSLLTAELTAEKLAALQNALGGLNQRIHEAAAKGDAAAQKALDAMNASGPKGGR
jgi:hypothetical protein